MFKYKPFFITLIYLFFFIFVFCNIAQAGNSASGTITVDEQEIKIKYASARPLFDDIIIVLTDNEVPKEMVPDGIFSLSEKGKIRGIMFSISSKNKRLLGKGESIQSLHFYPVWEQLGVIGNGELQVNSSDKNSIEARIYTPSENKWGDHSFSYDIKFTADIKKEPVKVKISGDSDAPSKAFSKYYMAVMAGNSNEFKKYIAKDRLKEMEKEPGMMDFFIEMQQAMSPTSVDIIRTEISGDKAILSINGTKGSDNTTGSIYMINENGKWKVEQEEWLSREGN